MQVRNRQTKPFLLFQTNSFLTLAQRWNVISVKLIIFHARRNNGSALFADFGKEIEAGGMGLIICKVGVCEGEIAKGEIGNGLENGGLGFVCVVMVKE